MKKFLIGMTAITLSITLAGCGNAAQESSLNNLSRQLDETSNIISGMTTSSPTAILIDGDDDLKSTSERTQEALLDEQQYRTAILTRATELKKCLAKDIKLSKAEASALKDLTLSLEKYTTMAEGSKSEMENSSKAISSLRKNVSKNKAKLEAKVNRLECNSNVRSAYFENILRTLEEIENQVGNCDDNQSYSQETDNKEENQETMQRPKRRLKKNIDTYRYIDDELPQERPLQRRFAKQNYRFNPTRNTDTYGPQRRNIDSYGGYNGYNQGFYPNGYGYGYPNQPLPYNNFNSNNFNRLTSPVYDGVMPVSEEQKEIAENKDVEEQSPATEQESHIETTENDQTTSVSAFKIKPEEDKIVHAH